MINALAQNLSNRFKIADRGFLLFSVPLLFVLVFFWELVEIQRLNEQAQLWSLHSHEVTAQTEVILRGLSDAQTAVNGSLLTGNLEYVGAFTHTAAGVRDSIGQLQILLADNPAQEILASQI